MRLVTYQRTDEGRVGATISDGVLDLADAGQHAGEEIPATMQGLIDGGERVWDAARRLIETCPDEAVVAGPRLLAPLPRPIRIRDCSLFLEHMELAMQKLGKVMHEQFKKQVI